MSRHRARVVGLLLVASLASVSCDRGRGRRIRPGGDVVAVVGDAPIRVDEVRALAEARGISAREALTALEDAALLAAEARRRGFSLDERRVHDRILVQALLRRIESEHGPDSVPRERVDERREAAAAYLRERSDVEPPPPPPESEITRVASEAALSAERGRVVGDLLRAQRARTRIDYREPVIAAIFARNDLFEGVR